VNYFKGEEMKILAVTGNRADYDLMSYLYKLLEQDREIEFRVLVTGAHLSPAFGYSKNAIDKDGLTILGEIENILNADSRKSRIKAASIFMMNAIDLIDSFRPDLMILAGDREEVLAGGMLGAYLSIPTIHFFGGDFVADGHVDNLARHSVSKLATYHFVSIEEHKRRLISMGEEEDRIYVIGNPGLDKFTTEPLVEREALMNRLGIEGFGEYAILIYHSPPDISGENDEIENIFKALEANRVKVVVGGTNTDYNHEAVKKVFDRYRSHKDFFFYQNLDRNLFINLYRNAKFQIGNSSAGILESASIPIPVINVGMRQTKRRAQKNVVFVDGQLEKIDNAIKKVTNPSFLQEISSIQNEYGDGNSSERAYELIKHLDLKKNLFKTYDPLSGIERSSL
jgi:GDP/UDP-N,N'-diacetylbacillosamine 2-epimerase (hydrolysing)